MMVLTVLEKLFNRPQTNSSFPRHRTPQERKNVDHSSRRQAGQPWSFLDVKYVLGNRCCLRHLRSSLAATGKKALVSIQRSVAKFLPVVGDDHTYDPEGETLGGDEEEEGAGRRGCRLVSPSSCKEDSCPCSYKYSSDQQPRKPRNEASLL